jgi:hypothetical protein
VAERKWSATKMEAERGTRPRFLSSVLSRNVKLRNKFHEKFGDQYRTVRDYYLPRKESAVIQDVSPFVPGLVAALEAAETEEE